MKLSRFPLPDDPKIVQGLKRIVAGYAVMLSIAVIVWCARNSSGLKFRDFAAFWSAARLMIQGRATAIYDSHAMFAVSGIASYLEGQRLHLTYPPFALPIYWPFGYLPFAVAWPLFVLLTGLLLWLVLRRIWNDKMTLWVMLASPAMALNAWVGQNGALSAALMGIALLYLEKKPSVSGASAGLLVGKIHLAPALLLAELCSKHWRALTAFAFMLAFLAAFANIIYGPAIWSAWWQVLPHNDRGLHAADTPYERMASVYAAMHLLGLSPQLSMALHGVIMLAALTLMVLLWRRKDAAFDLKAASVPFATLLISPYLFYYDYPVSLIGLAFWMRYAQQTGFRPHEFMLMALVWALPLWLATNNFLPLALPQYSLLYVLVFLYRRA